MSDQHTDKIREAFEKIFPKEKSDNSPLGLQIREAIFMGYQVATARERKLADELAEALSLLITAKKQKDAFGRDDKCYQQIKRDGWHLASVAIAKHQAARGM